MTLNKPLESIEESDLQALIDNQVAECKTIEYKEALPGNSDGDKKEFLADVSSFANASGGDLIYGIKEQAGLPIELSGLSVSDVDAEILRLESCIQTGIAPRLFRMVDIHPVSLPSKQQYTIIIRLRKSWISPHTVTFKNDSKFYSRSSKGKYQLDVSELRNAFLLSETAAERIRNFRTERLGNIIAGETPVKLDEDFPKLVLHIVPFNSFEPTANFDLNSLSRNYKGMLEPLSWLMNKGGYSSPRYNFDGLVRGDISTRSYTQVFRNGSIEVVDNFILRTAMEQLISAILYEKGILVGLKSYFDAQKQLGVEPPLFVMVSFLDVKGYGITFERFYSGRYDKKDYEIDRANLIVPEILTDNYDCDFAEIMKPIFDTIANAARWPRSMSYDENGKFMPEWQGTF